MIRGHSPPAVARAYLDRYAEPEHRLGAVLGSYERVLTVPSHAEGANIASLLESIPKAGETLVIVVVNESMDATASIRVSNQATLAVLQSFGCTRPITEGATLVSTPDYDILAMDRTCSGRPFSPDQGVGLARKIGADVALSLHAEGRLATDWMWCTDADAILPVDYFDQVMDETAVAYLYDFEHVPVAGHESAIERYEAHLLRYALGLEQARSPYAFHCIGSTVAFRASAYAAVRGVPCRRAGEDFYLLGKLAKVGAVDQSPGSRLALSGRPSERVPFGTGAAVARQKSSPARTYDPRSFDVLGAWLHAMETGFDVSPAATFRRKLPAALEPQADACLTLLRQLGALSAVTRARGATRSRVAYRKHVHTFFDAFRTMKFVRQLRDVFGDVEVAHTLAIESPLDALRLQDRKRRTARPLVGLATGSL